MNGSTSISALKSAWSYVVLTSRMGAKGKAVFERNSQFKTHDSEFRKFVYVYVHMHNRILIIGDGVRYGRKDGTTNGTFTNAIP